MCQASAAKILCKMKFNTCSHQKSLKKKSKKHSAGMESIPCGHLAKWLCNGLLASLDCTGRKEAYLSVEVVAQCFCSPMWAIAWLHSTTRCTTLPARGQPSDAWGSLLVPLASWQGDGVAIKELQGDCQLLGTALALDALGKLMIHAFQLSLR